MINTPRRLSVSTWALHELIGTVAPGRPGDLDARLMPPREGGTLSAEPAPIAPSADVDADAVCESGGLGFPGAPGSSMVLGIDPELIAPLVALSATRSSVRTPPLIVLGGPAFFAISASSVFFSSPAVDCLPPTMMIARSSKLNKLFGVN